MRQNHPQLRLARWIVRRAFVVFGSALTAFSLSGCVPEIDDDLSQVDAARVVAMQSLPAEAAAGDEVKISALVVSSAPVDSDKVSWALCLERKPLTELGAVAPDCLKVDADPKTSAALGSGLEVSAVIPKNACQLFGPLRPDAKPGEPPGRPVDPDPTGGFYQPVVNWLSSSDAAVVGVRLECGLYGVEREDLVEYRDRYRKNENPALSAIEIVHRDGTKETAQEEAPVTVKPGETVRLDASWPQCPRESKCGDGVCGAKEDATNCPDDCTMPKGCGGAESYVWFDPEQHVVADRREALTLAWYTTAGKLDEERTGISETDPDETTSSNVWVAPQKPGVVKQWVVVQDNRGGASWRSFQFEVAP